MANVLNSPDEVWVESLWLGIEIRTPSGSSLIIPLTGLIDGSNSIEFNKFPQAVTGTGDDIKCLSGVEVGMEDTHLWIIYYGVPSLALSTLISFFKLHCFCNFVI